MEAYKTISFALLATWAACALVERNDSAGLVRSTVAMDIVPKKAAAFDKVDRRLAKHDDRLATLEQKVDFFAPPPPML